MVYRPDDKAIRSSQEEVDRAKYQIQISEIEKSISKLEEARDKETEAIDEMISKLQDYKESWQDITSAYAEAQEDLIAEQILGAGWETDILNGRLDVLDNFKNQYISIQQAMADAAWQSANEQIKAAQEAEKGAGGTPSSASAISKGDSTTPLPVNSVISGALAGALGGGKFQTTKYASGTNNAKKGLNLVGEDEEELYFDNHDHVAVVTKPTLIPMEGGEVVKNAQDTKKLLNSDNLKPVDNIGLTDIDGKEAKYTIKVNIETNGDIPDVPKSAVADVGTIIRPDGSVLRPLQQGDRMYDLVQKFDAFLQKQGGDIDSILTPVSAIQKDMERLANSISGVNSISNSNNRIQNVSIGDIHVVCPGVTSQEVMKQIGAELDKQFRGFSLTALQESKKR